MDNHIALNILPSNYVPYPEGTRIAIRTLTWGEVDFLFQNEGHIIDILDYFKRRQIIKGVDFEEITVDDWAFLELTIVNRTFPGVEYNIYGGKCPQCENEVNSIYLSDANDPKPIIPDLKKIVLPQNISFKSLDPEVKMPIQAELSIGVVDIDFLRIKHYRKLIEENALNSVIRRMELMVGAKMEDLSLMDGELLMYVMEKLNHGPNRTFELVCPKCQYSMTVSSDWRVTNYIPFRESGLLETSRIHFGQRITPTSTITSKPRISERPKFIHSPVEK